MITPIMRRGVKNKNCRNVSGYKLSLIAVLCTSLAGVPACSGQEAQSEHFDNNSTGMDRDKTEVHKTDTLKIDNSEIKDSVNN